MVSAVWGEKETGRFWGGRLHPSEFESTVVQLFVVVKFDYPEKNTTREGEIVIINKYFVHRQFVSFPILRQKGSSTRFMEPN